MILNEQAVERLLEDEVTESVVLDFKGALYEQTGEKKKEFLYDVAAFANTQGGDLLIGIDERREGGSTTGIAGSISGIRIENVQREIERMENLIRDGIRPALGGVAITHIPCADGDVLQLQIPKSWHAPHMVVLGGTNKFYARHSTGNHPMTVEEIRRSFLQQGELGHTIRQWRKSRVKLINSQDGPVPLANPVAMLIHFVPASAFTGEASLVPWTLTREESGSLYVPGGHGMETRYNGDGFLKFYRNSYRQPEVDAYTQVFRSGALEYCSNAGWRSEDSPGGVFNASAPQGYIYAQHLEQTVVESYEDALRIFKARGETSRVFMGLCLIGGKGRRIFSGYWGHERSDEVRDDPFVSPEALVAPAGEERPYSVALRPLVDMIWQLGGREKTPYFSADGEWDPYMRVR